MNTPARTRFAPSPTGALHCGVVRTALYAWLLAKQSGGQFLLRIEDTDQKREVEGGLQNIKDTLRWLGLTWDEGPDVDGPYGPYVQSQRLDIYKQYAQDLLDKGLAYVDPYSKEELQALRDQAKAEKRPFLFRDHRPQNPPAWDGTKPLRIRLEPKAWSWHDAVMGEVKMGPEMIDDYIIVKADGFPTYNFCHIIDDYLMKITHVTRSQEFISSIPKFLAAHEVLGLPTPINVTLPQIMDETGRAKLSKRKGAKPVLYYRDQGFLPEALVDFLATIGWNDGTTQESFTIDELIAKFSLDHVHHSGGIFNEQRLLWLNGLHIRKLPLDDLYARATDFWPAQAAARDDAYKKSVLALVQERLKFLAELPALTAFFFQDLPVNPALWQDNKQLKKYNAAQLTDWLTQGRASLADSDFSVADLTDRLNKLLEQTGQKPGVLFSIIRIATTQAPASPGLADTLAVLGKNTSLRRTDAMLQAL